MVNSRYHIVLASNSPVNSRYHIVLASNSPRRKELLSGLDIPFEVRVLDGIDESYPAELSTKETAGYISKKKADAYQLTMGADELIITGKTHQVITGVCLTTKERQVSFSVETDVTFKKLTDEEIDYYVDHYRPFDKAGAYGIQEWIGHVGVTGMNGSYFNVMGLPVQRIYEALKGFTIIIPTFASTQLVI